MSRVYFNKYSYLCSLYVINTCKSAPHNAPPGEFFHEFSSRGNGFRAPDSGARHVREAKLYRLFLSLIACFYHHQLEARRNREGNRAAVEAARKRREMRFMRSAFDRYRTATTVHGQRGIIPAPTRCQDFPPSLHEKTHDKSRTKSEQRKRHIFYNLYSTVAFYFDILGVSPFM